MSSSPRHQRGVALLVALLVVALAVILIAALLDRGELALARTRNALRSEQAEAYAQGLEIYAAAVLEATFDQAPTIDTNASPWALPLPPQEVPGGVIAATMRDLNGCFNLNNLGPQSSAPVQWKPFFQRLLGNVGLDPSLEDAVSEWLNPAGDGANGYLALAPAYRPAGRPFLHVSELRLVRGFDSDVFARIAPYVCALPPGSTINLNTAPAAILQSIDESISAALATTLWNNGQANFQGIQDFRQQARITFAPPQIQFGFASQYFIARGDIVLDDVPFTFYSVIERRLGAGVGDAGGIRVLSRSRGSDDALIAPVPTATQTGGTSLR